MQGFSQLRVFIKLLLRLTITSDIHVTVGIFNRSGQITCNLNELGVGVGANDVYVADDGVTTRRFMLEQDADKYAEYVAMGWREPEPHDIGRVVFYRSFKRTDAIIKARMILRDAYVHPETYARGHERGGV